MPTYDYDLLNPFKKSSYEPSTHQMTPYFHDIDFSSPIYYNCLLHPLDLGCANFTLDELEERRVALMTPATVEFLLNAGVPMAKINEILTKHSSDR